MTKTPQQIRNEVEKAGKEINIIYTLIPLTIIIIVFFIGIIIIFNPFKEQSFIFSCESFGGEYHIFGDGGVEGFVECSVKYPYCQDTCILNGKWYNYYDVPKFNLGKYFCVEDCKYENSNGRNCVC